MVFNAYPKGSNKILLQGHTVSNTIEKLKERYKRMEIQNDCITSEVRKLDSRNTYIIIKVREVSTQTTLSLIKKLVTSKSKYKIDTESLLCREYEFYIRKENNIRPIIKY